MFIFNKRGRRIYIHVFSSFHDAKTLLRNKYRAKFDTIGDFINLHIIYIYIYNDIFNLSIVECFQSFLETKILCVEWNHKKLNSVNCNVITQMLARCKNATALESLVLWIVGLFKNNFISCKYHNFVRSASRIRAETSQTFLFRIKILMVIFYRNRMTLSYPLCFRRLLLLSWWQLLFSSLFKRCCICLNLIDYMYLYMPI